MGIVIDIILVAIFAICIGIGYFRGLTGSLLKIVSFILALIIAFVLFKPIANFVVDNTNWDENLEQAIRQMVIQEAENENSEQNVQSENAQQNSEANVQNKNAQQNIEINVSAEELQQANSNLQEQIQTMPTVITDYINETVEQAGNDAKEAIVDATARNVAVTIINVCVLIALFIVSRIVLLLVKGLAELLTKLPVIKQFDKLGGILYGLLEALIIVYLLLAILSFISPMIAQTGVMSWIQETYITKMFYNNNLLLMLIF